MHIEWLYSSSISQSYRGFTGFGGICSGIPRLNTASRVSEKKLPPQGGREKQSKTLVKLFFFRKPPIGEEREKLLTQSSDIFNPISCNSKKPFPVIENPFFRIFILSVGRFLPVGRIFGAFLEAPKRQKSLCFFSETNAQGIIKRIARPSTTQLTSRFDSGATHARTQLTAALASVPFGFVLARVRVDKNSTMVDWFRL
jgi:hypothetical protein